MNTGNTTTCVTERESKTFTLQWDIKQFSVHSTHCDIGKAIKSIEFGDEANRFFLLIYPQGYSGSSRKYVSAEFVVKECSVGTPYSCAVEFNIEREDSSTYVIPGELGLMAEDDNSVINERLLEAAEVSEAFSPNDTLSLTVKCSVYGNIRTFDPEQGSSNSFSSAHDLKRKTISGRSSSDTSLLSEAKRKNLDVCEKYLESGDFHDVEVKCGERVFSLHRVFLAARSEFFAAKFRSKVHKNNENVDQNEVDLSDMDVDILDSVIQYIYTSRCPLLKERPLDVLKCSDRLLIDDLKTECVELLCKSLSVKNVCERLVIADSIKLPGLLEAAIQFFGWNRTDVVRSEQWKQLKTDHAALYVYVLESSLGISDI